MASPYPVLPGTPASTFVLRCLSAVAIKLSASVDDVAWLLPFVAGPRRRTNLLCGLQYVVTTLVVASVASAIAVGGGAAISAATDDGSPWPSERVLGLTSGIALALYSVVLFKGWFEERQEAQEEEATERASNALASIVSQARAAEAFFRTSGADSKTRPASAPAATASSAASADADADAGFFGWLQSVLSPAPSAPRAIEIEVTPVSAARALPTLSAGAEGFSTPRPRVPIAPEETAPGALAASATASVLDGKEGEAEEEVEMGDDDAALAVVERCRALRRLREPLGAHYASRKERLLHELDALPSVEGVASALDELRRSGFIETE